MSNHNARDSTTAPQGGSSSVATAGREQSRRQAVLLAGVLATAGLNFAFLFISPPDTDVIRLAYGTAMLWLSVGPALHYLATLPQEIPFVPLVAPLYFVYFGMPVFTGTVLIHDVPFDRPELTTAVGLAALGEALMFVAFYTPAGKFVDLVPRLRLKLDLRSMSGHMLVAAYVCLVFTTLSYYARVPLQLQAIVVVLGAAPVLLSCGLYLMYLRGELARTRAILSAGVLALYVMLAFATGSLANVAYAITPLFLLYVAERRRIPYKAAAIGLLVMVPFLKTKHEFRRLSWDRTDISILDRAQLFTTITYDALDKGGFDFTTDAVETSQQRTSYLGTFAYVVSLTPSRVPYWEGETYVPLLWKFVPRLLAPDKPILGLGQEFGHRYRLISSGDKNTSVNLAQVVEMYVNFGPLGVCVGMFLLGLIYRLLYRLINHNEGGAGPLIIGATLFTHLGNIESNAELVVFGAPWSLASYFVILAGLAFLSRRFTHARLATT
jgi:hypothetical protein